MVISPKENCFKNPQILRLHTAEVAGPNPAEPIVLFTIGYTRTVH